MPSRPPRRARGSGVKGDHTPNRGIRIPDALWTAAKAKADAEHVTLTSVIIRALQEYVLR